MVSCYGEEQALKTEYIKKVYDRANTFCEERDDLCPQCPIQKECDAFTEAINDGSDLNYTETRFKLAQELDSAMSMNLLDNTFNTEQSLTVSNINHPYHYFHGSIECIDAMVETQGKEAVMAFCICNAMKYIWRHNSKNGVEDVRKAKWYIDKYLELYDEKPVEQPKTSSECYVPD